MEPSVLVGASAKRSRVDARALISLAPKRVLGFRRYRGACVPNAYCAAGRGQ